MAALRAYSVMYVHKAEGAPEFVPPPWQTKSWFPYFTNPFVAWFSSDLGRPLTRSIFTHLPLSLYNFEITPELVQRLTSPKLPAPIRESLDVIYIIGLAASPSTNIPVTCLFLPGAYVPSSLWLGISLTKVMVS